MEKLIAPGRMAERWREREPSSILVVRLKALGDIVLSLPVVRALRARFPGSRIRYLCRERYAAALAGVREIDEVLVLPEPAARQARFAAALRRDRPDCVIDLLGSPRSAVLSALCGARLRIGMDTRRHNWCYHLVLPRALYRGGERVKCYTLDSNEELVRLLGLPADERRGCGAEGAGEGSGGGREDGSRARGLESVALDGGRGTRDDGRYAIGFPAAEGERDWARRYAEAAARGRALLVGLVPGALYQAKSWREEYFIEIARRLRDTMDAAVIVLWGPGERALAERIASNAPGAAAAPETGVARLGALVGELDCLAGIDSGPKHLAVVQGVPTVTLFGPTDPRIWVPMTERHRALHAAADCFPCRKRECVPNRCLDRITPDMVMAEIGAAIAAAGGRGRGRGRPRE